MLAGAKNATQFNMFQAAFNAIDDSRQVRNKFAHHLWGVSEHLLAELLLQDPRDANLDYARISNIGK